MQYVPNAPRINRQPLLDSRQTQLELVFSASEGIETKALAILGSNIAILIFIAQSSLTLSTMWVAALFATFGISVLLDVIAIWPRTYRGNVSVVQHPEYLSYDEETLILQLLANTEESIQLNGQINQKRLRYCTWSIALSLFGSCILIYTLLQ